MKLILLLVTIVICWTGSDAFMGLHMKALSTTRSARLKMVATENHPTTSSDGKLIVTNAFDSPSVKTRMSKSNEELNDAFKSPSALVNGGQKDKETSVDVNKSPSIILNARAGTENADAMESPSCTFLGINNDAIKNAMTSPSLQTTSESKTSQDMPLSLVVGMENIKTALILLAVNPQIGGLVIAGGKGTAKSVMARALHRVMPPIERIKGNEYNIDPSDTNINALDDFTRKELEEAGKTIKDVETEIITCPFVQVPVNVMEDRLFGSVDVKKTLETGETIFTPGLLANAHRGILYVDDINLLDTDLVTMLLQAITDGFVVVEREGISVRYPCKPLLIATMNSNDNELKDVFLDRIGIALNADTEPLTLEERIEAVEKVINFSEGKMDPEELASTFEAEEQLKNSIIFSREYLKEKKCSIEQLTYLCEEAGRGGCQGHRAELSAARVALASAALEDAPVRADDLRLAVKLAIVPRSIFRDQMEQEEMMPPPPPPPPPQASQEPDENVDNENNEDEDNDENENEDDQDDEDDDEEEDASQDNSIPEEFMFEAENVATDDDMLKFKGRQKAGKGGKSGVIFSRDRGRYLRPVPPKEGQPLRVAIDATLREAAKKQVERRAAAAARGGDPTRTYLEPEDVRGKLMARKAGSLLIFAVDASGSMALNRMNAAKGAACGLLTEAYQSRDQIALIPFQGNYADVLLPPTRSISLAKSRLDTMPCGGGSPLAHALSQAVRTAFNAMSSGDVGKCIIVLISDGRANVPLSISTGEEEPPVPGAEKKKISDAEKKEQRQALKDEVMGLARQIGEIPNINLLVIDTENKFVSTGMAKEIADAAQGKYHFIPKASADAMKQVTSEAVSSLKSQNKKR